MQFSCILWIPTLSWRVMVSSDLVLGMSLHRCGWWHCFQAHTSTTRKDKRRDINGVTMADVFFKRSSLSISQNIKLFLSVPLIILVPMSPVWVSEPLNNEPRDSCNKNIFQVKKYAVYVLWSNSLKVKWKNLTLLWLQGIRWRPVQENKSSLYFSNKKRRNFTNESYTMAVDGSLNGPTGSERSGGLWACASVWSVNIFVWKPQSSVKRQYNQKDMQSDNKER